VPRYVVEITATADKALAKLARGQPRDGARIEDAIKDLADQPRPPGCTPLTGFTGVWRIRIGAYRVCYRIEEAKLVVLVLTVSTRDNVYERLRRMLE
jgi:mRNA interferase RelE/StbE